MKAKLLTVALLSRYDPKLVFLSFRRQYATHPNFLLVLKLVVPFEV